MSSYLGRHAELYDLFYAEKPYANEAAFAAQLAADHGIQPPARWLDVACGSGRHALEWEQLGFQVTGVDYSADLLTQAQRRAHAQQSQVRFLGQDMRQLDVPGGPFDVVSCLFDAIGYVQTNEAVLQVLRHFRSHLRPGGLLIMEFWHAAGMLKGFDPLRLRRWRLPDREILRISETSVDVSRQLCHVQYTVHELRDDAIFASFTETQSNRYFLVQEMALFIELAGLTPKTWHAGYETEQPINRDTFHVIVAAERPA